MRTLSVIRATHQTAKRPQVVKWPRAEFVTSRKGMLEHQQTRGHSAIHSVMPNMALASDWLVTIVIKLRLELHNRGR
jgi:hypothetical protein